jgi:acetyl esterase
MAYDVLNFFKTTLYFMRNFYIRVCTAFLCIFFSVSFAFQYSHGKKPFEIDAEHPYPLNNYSDCNSDDILIETEFRIQQDLQASIRENLKKLDDMPERYLKDYSYGAHWRNTMDFWKAESDKPTPVVIFFHGGNFTGGDKSSYYGDSLVIACLNNGISVITANYRYITQASFPGPFLDAARLIQYVRHNAGQWGIDPELIAAKGRSAGGNLSIWLAVYDDLADPDNQDPVLRHSSRLTTIIAKNAQTSNDPFFVWENIYNGNNVHSAVYDFFGLEEMSRYGLANELSKKKYREMAFEASPLNHVTKDDPPVFLIYPQRIDEWDGNPLPEGTKQSKYIHHVSFGIFFKEQYDQASLECELRSARDVNVADKLLWLQKYFDID